jgi:acylphosphatase
MLARRLLIKGKVQGVFYRGWSERNARDLGLDGWVRNLRSGEVELLASGPSEALDELVRRCWSGPPAAHVADIEVSESEEPVEPGFAQRPTA